MPPAGQALVAGRLMRPREPGLVVEPDAHEEISGPEARELSGLEIDGVGILERRREAVDADAISTHDLDQGSEIGRRRHDGEGTAAACDGGRAQRQDDDEADASYDFFVKADFGIMQCTPLRTSTTWLTRQSPIIEVSEYAS